MNAKTRRRDKHREFENENFNAWLKSKYETPWELFSVNEYDEFRTKFHGKRLSHAVEVFEDDLFECCEQHNDESYFKHPVVATMYQPESLETGLVHEPHVCDPCLNVSHVIDDSHSADSVRAHDDDLIDCGIENAFLCLRSGVIKLSQWVAIYLVLLSCSSALCKLKHVYAEHSNGNYNLSVDFQRDYNSIYSERNLINETNETQRYIFEYDQSRSQYDAPNNMTEWIRCVNRCHYDFSVHIDDDYLYVYEYRLKFFFWFNERKRFIEFQFVMNETCIGSFDDYSACTEYEPWELRNPPSIPKCHSTFQFKRRILYELIIHGRLSKEFIFLYCEFKPYV